MGWYGGWRKKIGPFELSWTKRGPRIKLVLWG